MPFDRSNYPADWEERSRRVRERAGNRCEWDGCGVPNAAVIHRCKDDPEVWALCQEREMACEDYDSELRPAIRVVLTVAHTIDGGALDCPDEELLALCQLHHLRLDAHLHARNAAETRRRRRIAAGQIELVTR